MRIQHEFEFKQIIDSDIKDILFDDFSGWLESNVVLLLEKRDMKTYRLAYFHQFDDPFDDDHDTEIYLKSACSEGWALDKDEYLWAAMPIVPS